MNDQNGVKLEVGQWVVYNRSGYLITGTVVGLGATIKIRPDDKFIGKYERFRYDRSTGDYTIPRKLMPSRVKNGYSTMVLADAKGIPVIT